MDELAWIQNWYGEQCNGDWEYCYGITIENLDNPGWKVDIPLTDTDLEEKSFQPVDVKRSEQDWMKCWTEMGWETGGKELGHPPNVLYFRAFCGTHNLTEVLKVFRIWSESEPL